MKPVRDSLNKFLRVFEGMVLTLRHVGRPKVTIKYPYERRPVSPRLRGNFYLKWNEEKERLNCTGCNKCAQACPTDVISMNKFATGVDEFVMDLGRCMFCGLCVEACPYDSLYSNDRYEFATTKQEGCVFRIEDLAQGGAENVARNAKTLHDIVAAKAARRAARSEGASADSEEGAE
mgnify:CR=1 FL=1